MSPTTANDLRRCAWGKRQELGFGLEVAIPADLVLEALVGSTGIDQIIVPSDDPLLAGALGVLNSAIDSILLSDDLDAADRRYVAAHEYAHWFLHKNDTNCLAEVFNLDIQDNLSSSAVAKVDGYSARERKESEANIFAAELLLPLQAAKRLFEESHYNSQRIACEVGISDAVARRQLADAVLLPIPLMTAPAFDSKTFSLDASQLEAAHVKSGPLLLSAGPGTGKTRTLVGRCLYLTETLGIAPERILALTFSRRSAAEMSERLIAGGVGTQQSRPWVGTFHSFGTEILRKYGDRIGLSDDFNVIDQLDAVVMLENNYSDLQLTELVSIHYPAQHLSGVLRQISRAKDELVSPEQFELIAQQMTVDAEEAVNQFEVKAGKKTKKERDGIEQRQRDAKRALECARVYKHYERLKNEYNLVDYSDLIYKSVKLLEENLDIARTMRQSFPHLLADEYQDVNRASARLLRLLAGDDATGLWVVGDHRQSIYQFQGASPANVSEFLHEYPNGILKELKINYRSVPEIVETFSSAATKMTFNSALDVASEWQPVRPSSRLNDVRVEIVEARNHDEQAHFIGTKILAHKERGIALDQMAVLCRTRKQAVEIANRLNLQAVSAIYQGPLLDRPEIKDLMSVLNASAAADESAIYRMAMLPEYAFDHHSAILLSKEFASKLNDSESNPMPDFLGEKGPESDARSRLWNHLKLLHPYINQPATLIRAYLFDCSQFLDYLDYGYQSEFDQVQAKAAIRQFIMLTEEFDRRAVKPLDDSRLSNRSQRLLRYLHKATFLQNATIGNDFGETGFIDAVRVSTVHSVKGLEFPVVFIPNMNDGEFPASGRSDGIPNVIAPVDENSFYEEQCLFFVALSRAKDYLTVTRSVTKASGQPTQASGLLDSLADVVANGTVIVNNAEPNESEPTQAVIFGNNQSELASYSVSSLDRYRRCPRQYYYRDVLGFSGSSTDDGYLKLSKVINQYLNWIDHSVTRSVDETSKCAKLEELWNLIGPVGYLHEKLLRNEAERVLLVNSTSTSDSKIDLSFVASLNNGSVRIPVNVLEDDGDVVTATVRKLGVRGDEDHTDARLALLRTALQQNYEGRRVEIDLKYAGDGSVHAVPASPAYEGKRVGKYERAIEEIKAERFPAQPNPSNSCRTCPFLIICPRDSCS